MKVGLSIAVLFWALFSTLTLLDVVLYWFTPTAIKFCAAASHLAAWLAHKLYTTQLTTSQHQQLHRDIHTTARCLEYLIHHHSAIDKHHLIFTHGLLHLTCIFHFASTSQRHQQWKQFFQQHHVTPDSYTLTRTQQTPAVYIKLPFHHHSHRTYHQTGHYYIGSTNMGIHCFATYNTQNWPQSSNPPSPWLPLHCPLRTVPPRSKSGLPNTTVRNLLSMSARSPPFSPRSPSETSPTLCRQQSASAYPWQEQPRWPTRHSHHAPDRSRLAATNAPVSDTSSSAIAAHTTGHVTGTHFQSTTTPATTTSNTLPPTNPCHFLLPHSAASLFPGHTTPHQTTTPYTKHSSHADNVEARQPALRQQSFKFRHLIPPRRAWHPWTLQCHYRSSPLRPLTPPIHQPTLSIHPHYTGSAIIPPNALSVHRQIHRQPNTTAPTPEQALQHHQPHQKQQAPFLQGVDPEYHQPGATHRTPTTPPAITLQQQHLPDHRPTS